MHKRNCSHIRGRIQQLLQHVAQNEQEKEILKHVLCQSRNLSKRKGSGLYGISLLRKRAIKVDVCACARKETEEKNLALAKEQKRSILLSYGLDPASILNSDSECNVALAYSSDDEEYHGRVLVKMRMMKTLKCVALINPVILSLKILILIIMLHWTY